MLSFAANLLCFSLAIQFKMAGQHWNLRCSTVVTIHKQTQHAEASTRFLGLIAQQHQKLSTMVRSGVTALWCKNTRNSRNREWKVELSNGANSFVEVPPSDVLASTLATADSLAQAFSLKSFQAEQQKQAKAEKAANRKKTTSTSEGQSRQRPEQAEKNAQTVNEKKKRPTENDRKRKTTTRAAVRSLNQKTTRLRPLAKSTRNKVIAFAFCHLILVLQTSTAAAFPDRLPSVSHASAAQPSASFEGLAPAAGFASVSPPAHFSSSLPSHFSTHPSFSASPFTHPPHAQFSHSPHSHFSSAPPSFSAAPFSPTPPFFGPTPPSFGPSHQFTQHSSVVGPNLDHFMHHMSLSSMQQKLSDVNQRLTEATVYAAVFASRLDSGR